MFLKKMYIFFKNAYFSLSCGRGLKFDKELIQKKEKSFSFYFDAVVVDVVVVVAVPVQHTSVTCEAKQDCCSVKK